MMDAQSLIIFAVQEITATSPSGSLQGLVDKLKLADPGQASFNINRLLMTAVSNRKEMATKVLLVAGANINHHEEETQNTPLLTAVLKDDAEMMKLLLERGANPNASNKDGFTPLHLSVRSKSQGISMVKMLLEAGASPRMRDTQGLIPLEYFPASHYPEIHQLLRSADEEIELRLQAASTALKTGVKSMTITKKPKGRI